MAFIELNDVTYTYPLMKEAALKNISYKFEKGKFYGVIGENAGGKTTLCNLFRGLVPHFYKGKLKGSATINGEDIKTIDVDKLSTQIGYIFQNPFTQISGVKKSVFEEIAIGLENLGVEKGEIIERVLKIAKLVNIESLLQKNPNELSGGQRQRVAFASVIAMDTDTFVIDEPTSQLDPDGTEAIFEIIHTLKEQGKTIVLVEHKVDLLAEYADEMLVMNKGNLIAGGPTKEVLSDLSLLEKGAMLPHTVLFNHELKLKGVELEHVPVTKEDCISQLKLRMK